MTEPTYRLITLACLWAAVIYVMSRELDVANRQVKAKQRRAETNVVRRAISEWWASDEYEALQEMPSWDIKPGWNRLSQFFEKEAA